MADFKARHFCAFGARARVHYVARAGAECVRANAKLGLWCCWLAVGCGRQRELFGSSAAVALLAERVLAQTKQRPDVGRIGAERPLVASCRATKVAVDRADNSQPTCTEQQLDFAELKLKKTRSNSGQPARSQVAPIKDSIKTPSARLSGFNLAV